MAAKGKKIILVEDDDAQKILVERLLSKLGLTVLGTVSTGEAAIKSFERFPDIDLIMIDIQLDGSLNGIETVHKIREMDEVGHLKVIYVSGYGDDEMKQKAMETRYDAFLTKPLNLEKLKLVLNEVF